jgi:hypothetical protein
MAMNAGMPIPAAMFDQSPFAVPLSLITAKLAQEKIQQGVFVFGHM